jgi:hypothetical protein
MHVLADAHSSATDGSLLMLMRKVNENFMPMRISTYRPPHIAQF